MRVLHDDIGELIETTEGALQKSEVHELTPGSKPLPGGPYARTTMLRASLVMMETVPAKSQKKKKKSHGGEKSTIMFVMDIE